MMSQAQVVRSNVSSWKSYNYYTFKDLTLNVGDRGLSIGDRE